VRLLQQIEGERLVHPVPNQARDLLAQERLEDQSLPVGVVVGVADQEHFPAREELVLEGLGECREVRVRQVGD